ncbi:MAG: hypothetical protein MUF42_15980 [Cytophagaceae bacterium]|jgi:hypothetical protein|nr:hypothetical protein [Cytophagaceae bacterium]
MNVLDQQIQQSTDWLIKASKTLNLKLDFSLHSMRYLDNLIDAQFEGGQPIVGGLMEHETGPKLFAIASYLGQVVLQHTPGTRWVTNDEDPEGERNIKIVSARGVEMFPFQRVLKRIYSTPEEEGLYEYVLKAVQSEMKQTSGENTQAQKSASWWKTLLGKR